MFNSDSETQTRTSITDAKISASGQANVNKQNRSGNTTVRVLGHGSYIVRNTFGLSKDDLQDVLANFNLNTGTTNQAPPRDPINQEARKQALDVIGPKGMALWIVGALVVVAFVAVGSVFWHAKGVK